MTIALKPAPHRTPAEIAQLVASFEDCSLSPAQFNHHAHMTVALWYLTELDYTAAVARMRSQIRKFAAHHQQHQLYNETITLFWMKLLRHQLEESDPAAPLADVIHRILSDWGSMEFVFRHYSRDVVFSAEARRAWVEPDLLPLGFEV